MILRPEQIKLLRLGRPIVPCNGGLFGGDGGSSSSSSSTTTNNTTQTLTQDRRIVADNGAVALSTDNSNVTFQTTDHGAVVAAIQGMQANSADALYASTQLSNTGEQMLKLNTDLARHLTDSNSNLVQQTLAQNQAALQTVAAVVSKPLDMNDPKNILVAAGMCAVAIVAIATFGKGK